MTGLPPARLGHCWRKTAWRRLRTLSGGFRLFDDNNHHAERGEAMRRCLATGLDRHMALQGIGDELQPAAPFGCAERETCRREAKCRVGGYGRIVRAAKHDRRIFAPTPWGGPSEAQLQPPFRHGADLQPRGQRLPHGEALHPRHETPAGRPHDSRGDGVEPHASPTPGPSLFALVAPSNGPLRSSAHPSFLQLAARVRAAPQRPDIRISFGSIRATYALLSASWRGSAKIFLNLLS